MKLTKSRIKHFENEQKMYGTKVALHNLVVTIATNLLEDLGIKRITLR